MYSSTEGQFAPLNFFVEKMEPLKSETQRQLDNQIM